MLKEFQINRILTLYPRTNANSIIRVSEILAIVDMESDGEEFFNGNEPLFWSNINTAYKTTGLKKDKIIDIFTMAGKISKFRFEPSIFKIVNGISKFSLEEKILLSSSFGLGQKLVYYWNNEQRYPKNDWVNQSRMFVFSPVLQLHTIKTDLYKLLKLSSYNRLLAYTRYNAGPSAASITEYGREVSTLVKEYSKFDVA